MSESRGHSGAAQPPDGGARAEPVSIPLRLVAGARRSGARTIGLAAPPPLSLYVHLPWCLRKCPYCDFNSHEWRAEGRPPEDRYLDALQADLEAELPQIWGRGVQTVFIGGGTPSLFSPAAIERLLTMIRARVKLVPGAEITLEANPGTFEARRFAAYADAGVTRLSIGVQSFSDAALAALGRAHDAAQARAAIEEAARHFETFNIDLMYALPGQTLAGLRRDLADALAFEPPHLSLYHLTIEPNTLFASKPPPLPDEDLSADMQALVEEMAGAAGLQRYEISAWARQGQRCRHNLNYWQFGDYLGIGAGAHGKLSFHDRIVRQARLRHPQRYMEALLGGGGVESAERASGVDSVGGASGGSGASAGPGPAVEVQRVLTRDELPFEFMLNALRLVEGVPATLFAERTGLDLSVIAAELARAVDRGLIDEDPTRLCASPLGLRFLNDLQEIFLRD